MLRTIGAQASDPPRSRLWPFLSRTPRPPSLSSRNSTPPFSSAIRSFSPVPGRPPKVPSAASNRLIVGMDTPEAAASFSWDHPSSARAALICRIDTFGIDIRVALIDTFGINTTLSTGETDVTAFNIRYKPSCPEAFYPEAFYRWLRFPHHHGSGRSCPATSLARKTRGTRTAGLFRKPDRPARRRHRAPQSALVRAKYPPNGQIHPTPHSTSSHPMDGGDPRRHRCGDRGGF